MFIWETAIRQHLEREKSLSKKIEGNWTAFFFSRIQNRPVRCLQSKYSQLVAVQRLLLALEAAFDVRHSSVARHQSPQRRTKHLREPVRRRGKPFMEEMF